MYELMNGFEMVNDTIELHTKSHCHNEYECNDILMLDMSESFYIYYIYVNYIGLN